MVFSVISDYTLSGDASMTLNMLTGKDVSGSSDLSTLSATNYLPGSDSTPNEMNQAVFKNQPLSWWVASLNSGAIKYTPFSNYVNWSYTDASENNIHMSIELTNLLIPNKTVSVSTNSVSMTSDITFEPKFGITRVDTHAL